MMRKKSNLSYRKSHQSKTHIARAKARREKWNKMPSPALILGKSIQFPDISDNNGSGSGADIADTPQFPHRRVMEEDFLGFDAIPLKPRLRVLSLFDGISTALYVLDKLDIHVDVYFSCEIHEKALVLQKFRFGDRITQLGAVETLEPKTNSKNLEKLGRIDLLLGGSPCNDISLVNPRRKGIHDPTSSGHLFFKFVDIMHYFQDKAQKNGLDFYWLFENTAKLENKCKSSMVKALGCEPLMICSSHFLPVKRARNYWGNFFHMVANVPNQRECTLNDILMPYRKPSVDTVPTLTTTFHSQRSGPSGKLPVMEDGVEAPLFITEREALFGFEPHFTDGPNLSITDRCRLLGKAFSVPVLCHLLTPLRHIFRNTAESGVHPLKF